MPSSWARADGSAKASSRIRVRSMAPWASIRCSPNADAMCGMAAPPAAVSWREIASVSTRWAPRSVSIWLTVDLPLPMPPVSPMTKPWPCG